MNCTPLIEMTCETCKYCAFQKASPPGTWHTIKMQDATSVDMYFCHYNPPVKGGTYRWPDVSKNSFCGKYEKKQPEE